MVSPGISGFNFGLTTKILLISSAYKAVRRGKMQPEFLLYILLEGPLLRREVTKPALVFEGEHLTVTPLHVDRPRSAQDRSRRIFHRRLPAVNKRFTEPAA